MTRPNDSTEFIVVPFRCPLPEICPVCGAPADDWATVKAWEGILGVLTYSVRVAVPFCERHASELRNFRFKQWAAIFGVFASPLVALLPAILDFSLSWLFWLGCLVSFCLLGITIRLAKIARTKTGVQMRTKGNTKCYYLRGVDPSWNGRLSTLVHEFNSRLTIDQTAR